MPEWVEIVAVSFATASCLLGVGASIALMWEWAEERASEAPELLPWWYEVLPLFVVRKLARQKANPITAVRTAKSHRAMVYVRPSVFISDQASNVIVTEEGGPFCSDQGEIVDG